ncbi:MAG: outer membrane beta-barrel protein, partial [Cyclobacteriaceae bacterium]|nr:outer membrane beta-barrel protein [Cyclobacteriaceae bacterium]
YESKTTLNLWYMDIPILFKWNFQIDERTNIYPAIGPYVGIGLKGKSKSESKSNYGEETYTNDVEWGSDEETDILKRFDGGLSIGGGIEYKAFQFGVYYNLGIANISAYTGDNTKIKNRVLQFSLGYRFLPKQKNKSDS